MATSRLTRLIWIVGICMSAAGWHAFARTGDTPPFYQIEYQGQHAYLLGSVHIGKADFYPLPDQIARAFDSSKALVVEADVAGADTAALLMKYGVNTMTVDDETSAVLSSYCQDKAALCAALNSYAPWLQSMQLSIARYSSLGYSAAYGVDHVLVSMAAERPVFALEGMEFQFKLLASFDEETQWGMVREAIEAPDAELLKLIDAWRSGDETQLADLMEGQMIRDGSMDMVEKMLWHRNEQMAAGIIQLMQSADTPQPIFIVVGAGHVVGQKSVQHFLSESGANSVNCWTETCN